MSKRIVSGIILILILTSIMHIEAVNAVALSSSFGSDLLSGGSSETVDWWMMFHHDLNHTGYSNSTVPSSLDTIWNSSGAISGKVRSSPAVVDGMVFVGSSDGNVYALNATTGEKLCDPFWANASVESSPAVFNNMVFVGAMNGTVYALNADSLTKNWSTSIGHAIKSSPAVDKDMVFVGSDDGYMYALNASTSSEVWRFRTAYAVNSSAAVSGDKIFIGVTDGRVYALDMEGRPEWHFDANASVESSPTVADGRVFVGSDDGKLYAIHENGTHLWDKTLGPAVKSSPAVAYGRVFVGSMNGSFYALNVTNGNILNTTTLGDSVYSSPAVADGKIFVGSSDNRTYILNATTFSPIESFTTQGCIYSSPAVADNKVFIGSDDWKVWCFGPENKKPIPIIEVDSAEPFILQTVTFNGSKSYDPDGNITSCTWDFGDGSIPEYYDDWDVGKTVTHIYKTTRPYTVNLTVKDDHDTIPEKNWTSIQIRVQEAWPMFRHDWSHSGNSTCLAPVTNQTKWNITIGEPESQDVPLSSPAIIDGIVYIGSNNGSVFALDAVTGSRKWNTQLNSTIHSSPAVADGIVYIGLWNGRVYALNASNGEPMETYGKPADPGYAETAGRIVSSPVVTEEYVFIGSSERWYRWDRDLRPDSVKNYYLDGSVDSSPTVSNGIVYIASKNKKVYARNVTTFGLISGWPEYGIELDDYIGSSPTVAYDKVFIGTQSGRVYAINVNGTEAWKNDTGGDVFSSPAVADGLVFIGSDDGYIYAFNATTGNREWKSEKAIGSVRWSSPTVAESKVFIGSKEGVFAFNEEDGKDAWSFAKPQTNRTFYSSPAIFNETLYIISRLGILYAFWNQTHDIALVEITTSLRTPQNSHYRVSQGDTVNINITIENQGSFNETNLIVTAYVNNTDVANSTIIKITRQDKTIRTLLWNTTGTPVGNYTLKCEVNIIPDEIDVDDNTLEYGIVEVYIGVHDIAVTNLTSCYGSTILTQNFTYTVNTTVTNEGDFAETFTLTLYWNNTNVINSTLVSLAIGETKVVQLDWNTTGLQRYMNYTLRAYATPVPGETDTADNTFDDPRILMMVYTGDINNDKKVDILDIASIAKLFGVIHPDPAYNPNMDIDCNGKIDIMDVALAAKQFGYVEPP
jgi:outer membrane protein assembly factor BamB